VFELELLGFSENGYKTPFFGDKPAFFGLENTEKQLFTLALKVVNQLLL
jgi:hypothetical protein